MSPAVSFASTFYFLDDPYEMKKYESFKITENVKITLNYKRLTVIQDSTTSVGWSDWLVVV